MGGNSDRPPASRAFADRLNHLFQHVHPPGRAPYTNEEVAAACGMTASALRYLRRGARLDPRRSSIEALAKFFGVSPEYFFSDTLAEEVNGELALLVAMRDVKVRALTTRVAGLSVASLEMITELVDRVREMEGLPRPMDALPSDDASGGPGAL